MQLILATLLLPLSQAFPAPVPVPVPVIEEGIALANVCSETCPEALSPICAKNAAGAFEIFDNPCMFNKANCKGLDYVQVDLSGCRGLITDSDGVPIEANGKFHDYWVLLLNWLLEKKRWWRCKTKKIDCGRG
ncbi:uncharacterized protein ASPGLDRAFT_991626 [Aspergillus glaucus CBS 516.65]|uniref:Uncharacterized protein n=1 Tax=Aspergillus glaucus CBS 516.65 TaxID=1160497 RepID=A0A1L9VV28_ASPGL|nr:hypothetical protein ASPGLDRAFT_991626 [Aspergillus glaucus CBS 516.65]OJJ87765.1 hypothetical protein ASPGLDRAFT_991626 [Aspergillus glaucus CBS 516.65]